MRLKEPEARAPEIATTIEAQQLQFTEDYSLPRGSSRLRYLLKKGTKTLFMCQFAILLLFSKSYHAEDASISFYIYF